MVSPLTFEPVPIRRKKYDVIITDAGKHGYKKMKFSLMQFVCENDKIKAKERLKC
jgi:hypothetical protein